MTSLLALLVSCADPAANAASLDAAPAEAPAPPPIVAATCPATVAELPIADPRLHDDAVIVVFKGARRVGLYGRGVQIDCWPTALAPGGGDAGHKTRRGDLKTPEGWYRTSDRPWSMYYHAITIHYPNPADGERALADGVIDVATAELIVAAERDGTMPPQQTALGSDILFHGGGSGGDWTLGCVALEDADIDALRGRLGAGMKGWTLILP